MAADGKIHELAFCKQAEIICTKFKIGDTKLSQKYSIAGVADRDVHIYVSEAAYEKLKQDARHLLLPDGGISHLGSYSQWGIRIEHMIPTEVVFRQFEKLHDAGRLTIDYVEHTIRDRLFCALITEDEDDRLTDEGWQRRMPDDWDFDTGDILARYKAAGIQMHKY